MDVLQMHIEVKQRLQKVGINSNDFFFGEEIDLALNKAMIRKVKGILDKHFEDTELPLSYLSNLIKKNKSLQVYVPQSPDTNYEDGMVYAVYPHDVLLLVNDRSTTLYDPCGNITNKQYENSLEYTAVVPFPVTTLGTGPYYSRVRVTLNGVSIYDIDSKITGVNNSKYTFPIINDILETVNRNATKYELYWETYRDTYYPNCFIFVSRDSSFNTQVVKIELYAADKLAVESSESDAITGSTYRAYSSAWDVSGLTSKVVPNKKKQSEKIYDHLNNPFYKAKHNEPLSAEAANLLYIYEGKNFIVSKVQIDYVRKPRQISLSLNQSCELSSEVHDEVVDLAVELLKLDIQDPTHRANVQESELRHQK